MIGRIKGVDRGLSAIVAEGFLSRLSFGLISFALPLFALRLGMGLAAIGLLASLNMVVAIALKPLTGWAADRFGLRRMFVGAIALRSVVSLSLAFAGAPWQLFAIRTLHGASIALRDPAANALLADRGGKKAVASAFAWYETSKNVAGAIGKSLAGILLTVTAANYPFVFGLSFVLSVLPLYVVVRYIPSDDPVVYTRLDRQLHAGRPRQGPDGNGERPQMLPYAVLGLLITGTAYMTSNLFPILATKYAHLSEAEAGAVFLLSTLVGFTAPVFGWLSDNVSRRLVLTIRSVSNTISSVLYLVAPNFGGLAAGRTLDDMGKAAFAPAWGALMARVASFDPRSRARVMSLISIGDDAGEIIGPILAGLLWSAWGVPVVLVTRIAMAGVAELYAVGLSRRTERPPGRFFYPAPAPVAAAMREQPVG